jgi:hypothetical protein
MMDQKHRLRRPNVMRYFVPVLLASFCQAVALPAILPDTIGAWQKGAPSAAPTPDQKIWVEYGLQDAETAPYADGARKFSISAWRFADATGAMSAFYEIRADAHQAPLMGLAVENAVRQIVAAGNYLFVFNGYRIKPEELSHVVATVPQYEHSPLPSLPKYMPAGSVPGSERYIMGPAALARFVPAVPSSTAGFHFSAEGEMARYGKKGKETTLVIFNYPTMEMARDRVPHFQEIPGAVVKRTGPLVAVALNAPNPNVAENLLAQVRYQATVTIPEHAPAPKVNFGSLLLGVVKLVFAVMGFCVASGLVMGGLRILFRRAGASGEGDNMISLHLTGRQ